MSADNVTEAGRRLRDLCSLPLAESPSSSPGLETLLVRDSWLSLIQARGPPTRPALPPFLFPVLPLRGEPSHLPVPTWLPAPASPSCPIPPACFCRSELQEIAFFILSLACSEASRGAPVPKSLRPNPLARCSGSAPAGGSGKTGTEESRGAFLMHPSSLRFPPLSLARQEAKSLWGLGRGLAHGDHSWIPAVRALSAARTDLPDLPLLPWGPTEAGPHSFHLGGSLRPRKGQKHGDRRRAPAWQHCKPALKV